MAILHWSRDRDVEWQYIAPDKPYQSVFTERFKANLRNDSLNETFFTSIAHARHKLESL